MVFVPAYRRISHSTFRSITAIFKKNRIPAFLCIITAIMVVSQTVKYGSGLLKSINVSYSLWSLNETDTLFDPYNTEYVYEYYLLENLAVGLLRDDVEHPSGYMGLLAESWSHQSPNVWKFKLKENLKWSDGSQIDGHYIAQYYLKLKEKRPRHMINLEFLHTARYDKNTNELTFTFEKETNRSVLHELSLADASLVHPSNLDQNWFISSGPYTVSEYDASVPRLVLKANENSVVFSKQMPQQVVLIAENQIQSRQDFDENEIDLHAVKLLSYGNERKEFVPELPNQIICHPIVVYYFMFSPTHPLSKNRLARKEMSQFIQTAALDVNIKNNIKFDNQIIPFGYSGRLENYPAPSPGETKKFKFLTNETLKLVVHSSFLEMGKLASNMQKIGRDNGFRIEFEFSDWAPKNLRNQGEFVRQYAIKGNQVNPIGTWRFLTSSKSSVLTHLGPFREQIDPYLQKAIKSQINDNFSYALQELHQYVLDENLIVPFAVQSPVLVMSSKIEFRKYNPFDSRFRFYHVQQKK